MGIQHMPLDDLKWADLSEGDGSELVEWLEGASCGPHVKAIVVRAIRTSNQGADADQWRHDLLAEHPDASKLLAEAEECMRHSGLWPWASG